MNHGIYAYEIWYGDRILTVCHAVCKSTITNMEKMRNFTFIHKFNVGIIFRSLQVLVYSQNIYNNNNNNKIFCSIIITKIIDKINIYYSININYLFLLISVM
jgi:hypothetical protein